MKKLLLVSLCFLMLFLTQAFAQNRTITGTVTAKDDGLPIPGVTVKIKGTNVGVPTDANGKYSISASSGTVLQFSFVAFVTQEVTVGDRSVVNVVLESNNKLLSEVVVTSLGLERQKKEIGYAATSVSSAEVNRAKPVNLINGLQGKVSGLNITTTNSGVFEDVKINLRGIRSLTGNNSPMLLLDGVQVPLSYLNSLNPNDIENTTILKGASSAAIYGPDAVNGAIVVTTKKGVAGAPPEVTLSNSSQFSSISKFPDFQTKFGNGSYGTFTPYENWSWGDAYDGSTRAIGPVYQASEADLEKVVYSPTNERKKFFNTATTIQNDISVKTASSYLSLQDALVNGIVPKDKNRRTGFRINTTQTYGILTATMNANYSQQNYNVFDDDAMNDYNTANNVGLNGGLMNLIFNTPAHIPLTSYKDWRNYKFADYNNYFNDYGLNPYFAIDNWRKYGKRENLIANLDLNLKATSWLSFTYRAAVTSNNLMERNTSMGITQNEYGDHRGFTPIPQRLDERAYRLNRLSSEFFASFNKTFANDYKVTALAGTYLRQDESRNTGVGTGSLVVPELYNVSQRVGELSGYSTGTLQRLFSLYGSVGFSYKGWASIEATGRNDQTSVLNTNNNSFFYPGVNASLVLTDAISFLKDNSTLSYLKLRGAWSKSGNANVGPYALLATFAQSTGFPFGPLPGYTANAQQPDLNLKPEFVKSIEVGAEFGFFNDKLTLEATYYNQDNTNQIIPISISNATGYTSTLINAASFKNSGVEFDLGLNRIASWKDGSFSFKANATFLESNITSISSTADELSIGGFATRASNFAIKGMPAFIMKATDYVRDPQGRVIIDANTGRPTADPTLKPFGQTMPKWVIGLNPSVNWKGATLSAVFEYKGGHQVFNKIGDDMAWTGVGILTAANNREHFVLPNSSYADPANPGQYLPNTNIAITNVNDFYTTEYRQVATNFLTSASAWRLRELSLAYTVPMKLLGGQTFIKGLSVAVTGRNLFLWVPKTNVYGDPDFTFGTTTGSNIGQNNTNISGIPDSQINPPTRTIGGNIVIKF